MNTVNLYTKLTSGSLTITNNDDIIEIYTRIIVLGNATEETVIDLNGTTGINLAGGMDMLVPNIQSLTVQSGDGVLVIGYKQSKKIKY